MVRDVWGLWAFHPIPRASSLLLMPSGASHIWPLTHWSQAGVRSQMPALLQGHNASFSLLNHCPLSLLSPISTVTFHHEREGGRPFLNPFFTCNLYHFLLSQIPYVHSKEWTLFFAQGYLWYHLQMPWNLVNYTDPPKPDLVTWALASWPGKKLTVADHGTVRIMPKGYKTMSPS